MIRFDGGPRFECVSGGTVRLVFTSSVLLVAAVACMAVAQIVGLVGLRMKLNLTATLAMLLLLAAALGLTVAGGLEIVPL